MNGEDPLASWRRNPFFVLEVGTEASRTEIERAGQRLLALMALGSARAAQYDTPLGPATRDTDTVREALAALRDPHQRVAYELMATVAQATGDGRSDSRGAAWIEAERALGWIGPWPG